MVDPREGLRLAKERKLDLVEVSPDAKPPVCKLLDYGKWRYERAKNNTKKKKTQTLREVKMRPKIGEHDYQVKTRTVQRLLEDGDKVKVTMRFRGREMAHQDRARELLARVVKDLKNAQRISAPSMNGRQMSMVLAPTGSDKA